MRVPPYPWPFSPGHYCPVVIRRPAEKGDLVLAPGPSLGVNLPMAFYLIDINSCCHVFEHILSVLSQPEPF